MVTINALRTDIDTRPVELFLIQGEIYDGETRLIHWSCVNCLGDGGRWETWVPEGTEPEPFVFYSIGR